jgi:hypothetical protein
VRLKLPTGAAVTAILCVAFAGPTSADRPAPAAAAPPTAAPARTVVLAPLVTLGAEAHSRRVQQISAELARGIDTVPGFRAVPDGDLRRALKTARRAELKACDGAPACLAELGALVGADVVVHGELGGLGDAEVVFLEAVEVAGARELRSTTVPFGTGHDSAREARAAATRLLAPERHLGRVELVLDVDRATVFLDGERVRKRKRHAFLAAVGTHALRVTHPEYRDYVRFVDVAFDETVTLEVAMQAFPIVASEMTQKEGVASPFGAPATPVATPTPWYRRWYTVTGAGVILLVGTAVGAGLLADGIDADREEVVGP